MAEDQPQPILPGQEFSPFAELGGSGLKRHGGYIFEEFLPELTGERGMKIYRQMLDNEPVVGSVIFTFEMLCRGVSWRVEPGGQDNHALEQADFLQSCLGDMSQTWEDTLTEILSMLGFGFSYHEIVYKQRNGASQDPSQRSQYTDGRIGWRKLPIRSQESMTRWQFDPSGGVQGMFQRPAPTYQEFFVPIDKALLFRPKVAKNNPEGRSVLRSAYRPWYFKRNIEQIEAIGIERDLAGLPYALVPPQMLARNATAEQKAGLEAIKKLVTQIRNDEQGCVVFPLAYDANGKELFKIGLMSTGGARQFDTNSIILRYDQRIAMTTLGDLILIGQQSTGSYALMDAKVRLFEKALMGWLESIAAVFNRHAIPRLFALNAWPATQLPRLVPGKIATPNLKEIAEYINALVGAGVILTPELEAHLLAVADLPVPTDIDTAVQ